MSTTVTFSEYKPIKIQSCIHGCRWSVHSSLIDHWVHRDLRQVFQINTNKEYESHVTLEKLIFVFLMIPLITYLGTGQYWVRPYTQIPYSPAVLYVFLKRFSSASLVLKLHQHLQYHPPHLQVAAPITLTQCGRYTGSTTNH